MSQSLSAPEPFRPAGSVIDGPKFARLFDRLEPRIAMNFDEQSDLRDCCPDFGTVGAAAALKPRRQGCRCRRD